MEVSSSISHRAWIALLFACAAAASAAQQGAAPPPTQAIYTCTDDRGHVITSDRPIAACMDRPQTELNPSGTVRRTIGPSLTGPERAAQQAKEGLAREEQAKQAEEKRRDRALLIRYPNRAAHDKERAQALGQVDDVIRAAQKRLAELQTQRQDIAAEYQFYQKDPSRAPASLQRETADNAHSIDVQTRFVAEQEAEKKRINARFDDELAKLKQLWALQAPVAR
ncbi:MAG: Exonuclease SbcC [Burkholderiaceae bacterium]|jgi:hypothetical protein|nr:MAG: Exonuclease SbcC [Burkholderiaceae bacterium]